MDGMYGYFFINNMDEVLIDEVTKKSQYIYGMTATSATQPLTSDHPMGFTSPWEEL